MKLASWVLAALTALPVSAATLTVTNTNDSGAGSLRQALTSAASGDRIEFAIGSGPQTIQPLTELPSQPFPIVIDARTQPGYSGTPIIELDGSVVTSGSNGLRSFRGEVYGLAVNKFNTGIELVSGGIFHCYIGLELGGNVTKPNWSWGVYSYGDAGGATTVIGENVFAHQGMGSLRVGDNVSVQGNTFGLNAAKTALLPIGSGISVEGDGSVIGGEAPNVIVNTQFGVLAVFTTNTRIEGNYLGTTPGGMTSYMERGLQLYLAIDTLVQNNVIAATVGIQVPGNDTTLRNKFLGNSIDATLIGIDLEAPAPFPNFTATPNDAGDVDVGPNNYLNYPVVGTSTTYNSQTTITGAISSVPNSTQHVELFASTACTSLESGPGKEFIDSFEITTDHTGAASFTRVVDPLPHGTLITATATTDADGTSEFSPCDSTEGPGTFSF